MYVLGTVDFQGCRRTDRRSHPVRGALFPGFPHVSKRSESTKLRLVRCTAGIRGKIRRCGAAATLPERMKTPPVPKVASSGSGDPLATMKAVMRSGVLLRERTSPYVSASVRPARGRPLSAQSLALSVRSGDAYHSAIRTDCVGKTTEKASESVNDRDPSSRKPKFAACFGRTEKAKGRPQATFRAEFFGRAPRPQPGSNEPSTLEPIEPFGQLLMRVQQPSGFFSRGFPSAPSSSSRSGVFVENQR